MSTEQGGGLGSFGAGKTTLGSLAQSARHKHINQARGVLIAIGILNLLVNGVALGMLTNNPGNINPAELQTYQLALAIGMGEGAVFFVLGLLTRKFPVPTTILGLTLYAADSAIWLANAQIIGIPWLRIIIFVALVKAVQSAIAYQKELKEAALQADPLA
jgi:hypothetical protein